MVIVYVVSENRFANIPTRLPLGMRKINVRVTDMFGREFWDEYHFEVIPTVQSTND